ncbi:Protein SRG1 [Dichanthelium oligosanthes]|uniref:Protein SRG1 n=1 Tax=Dichanthelium oligosanthes TaxID=888268 RepID=A0A1E5UTV4_9POAL|nr:Protein SRG1 [Dichanthelium oligosanthes]
MAEDQAQPWKIPPIVQELAAGVQEPPSRYVAHEQDRPAVAAAAAMPEPIPIVDLSRLSAADDDGGANEVAKLQSALQNWGLFLVIKPLSFLVVFRYHDGVIDDQAQFGSVSVQAVGHGMEPEFLAEMMEATRGFFNLPLEEKQRYSNLVDGKEFSFEGYGNDMVVSEDQILDWCDRLYLIVEPESRIVHSLWPARPPAFSDVMREYTARCRAIADVVLASLARQLGLHEGCFVGMMNEGLAMTHARFNYYPRCPRPDLVLGLKPHSDASVITVVLIDDAVSGLQVQKPNDGAGVWYDVPIVPNALLINVGDAIEIMSNGFFMSPVHRAVTNAERDRVSLAMFYTLDPEKEIEPLPELVDEKRPRRYGKTTTKDYLAVLFERFARGGRAMDTVKISTAQPDSGTRSEDG